MHMKKISNPYYLNSLIWIAILAFIFSGCASTPKQSGRQGGEQSTSNTPASENLLIQQSLSYKAWQSAQQHEYAQAQSLIEQAKPIALSTFEQLYIAWAEAILLQQQALILQQQLDKPQDTQAIHANQIPQAPSPKDTDARLMNKLLKEAQNKLNQDFILNQVDLLQISEQIDFWRLQAELLEAQRKALAAFKLRLYLEPLLQQALNNKESNTTKLNYLSNHQSIWRNLKTLSHQDLANYYQQEQAKNPNSDTAAWLHLALISLHSTQSLSEQISLIEDWQLQFSTHPAGLIPPEEISILRQALRHRPQKIAVILPLNGKYKAVGQAIRDGILNNFYSGSYKPSLMFYSVDNAEDFLATYQGAIDDNADWVIGPLLKEQLELLYTQEQLPVPTMALNTLNTEQEAPANLFSFSLSKNDEIDSLIKLMQAQNSKRIVTIAQEGQWSHDSADYFEQQWNNTELEQASLGQFFFKNSREQSNTVQQALNIDDSKTRIRKLKWLLGNNIEAEPRRRQDLDGILMLSKPKETASLRPLLAFHYASTLNMYASSSVYRGYPDKKKDNDMRGIQFTDAPFVIQNAQQADPYYGRSRMIRMYAFGLDALSLAERFSLMQQFPGSSFHGASGSLSISDNQVHRLSSYALFKSGVAIALPEARFKQKLTEPESQQAP